MPDGVPITIAPERREEFSPGLDRELLALIQATAEVEAKTAGSLDTTASIDLNPPPAGFVQQQQAPVRGAYGGLLSGRG